MSTDPVVGQADILTLTQWFSPAYPVGAFAYSHGLEWAIADQVVTDAATLADWIETILRHGTGRSDALFLAAAYRAEDTAALDRIDATCRAFAPARERLAETELQGRAFCETTQAVFGPHLSALCYPVAVGHAAQVLGLPLGLTTTLYLHAFAANLASVGMRLVPLGQTDGHRIIQRLAPLCRDIADQTGSGDLDALSGTAFLADIAAMKHETQYSRTFRT